MAWKSLRTTKSATAVSKKRQCHLLDTSLVKGKHKFTHRLWYNYIEFNKYGRPNRFYEVFYVKKEKFFTTKILLYFMNLKTDVRISQ
jgi:hypothetical protein